MQRGRPGHQSEHAGDVGGLCGFGPILPLRAGDARASCWTAVCASIWLSRSGSGSIAPTWKEDIARIARALVPDGSLFVVNQRDRAVPTIELVGLTTASTCTRYFARASGSGPEDRSRRRIRPGTCPASPHGPPIGDYHSSVASIRQRTLAVRPTFVSCWRSIARGVRGHGTAPCSRSRPR